MIATASPAALQHDGVLVLLIAWILGATLRLEAGAQGLAIPHVLGEQLVVDRRRHDGDFGDPFMMLMMHYLASIASLASPDPIFTPFLTLALERSPPPSSGFTLSKGAFSHPPPPPHTPLTHFVRSKSSSLPSLSAGFRNYSIWFKQHQSVCNNFQQPTALPCPLVSSPRTQLSQGMLPDKQLSLVDRRTHEAPKRMGLLMLAHALSLGNISCGGPLFYVKFDEVKVLRLQLHP